MPNWLSFVSGITCFIAAAVYVYSTSRTPVWVVTRLDKVLVQAKTSDGKVFTVLQFDRRFLDDNGQVIGIDIVKAPDKEPPHI